MPNAVSSGADMNDVSARPPSFPTQSDPTVIGVARDLAALEHDWDDLADRVDAPPFLRHGWIAAWWAAFATGRLEILTARRGGQLVGLVPLLRSRSALKSATNAHTPQFGILAQDRASARSLAEALLQRAPWCATLRFVDPAADATREFMSAAAARGQVLSVILLRSPYVDLQDGREAVVDRLRSKLRADLRRRRRRLEERGTVTIEIDGRGDHEQLLREGFLLETSGWKALRRSAIVSRENTRRFYTSFARSAAHRGWLRLAFIRLDGRPIAFQLALEDGQRYYFLKGGYLPAFRRYAPMKLLVSATLERAHALGLKSYEFLGNEEPWKLEWTQTCRERVRIDAFPRSPFGFAAWAIVMSALQYGKPLVKRVLAARP